MRRIKALAVLAAEQALNKPPVQLVVNKRNL
jgi:hypothetical protein